MNEKLYDVFVSYSTKDSTTAFSVVSAFEEQGISCWIAPRNIPNGTLWADAIDTAIEKSRIFLVIVSENSINSKQVPKEIALAITNCDHIVPLRIDQVDLVGSFRYYLSDYQWVDAQPGVSATISTLAQDVLRILGRQPVAPVVAERVISEHVVAQEQKKQVEKSARKPLPFILGGIAAVIAVIVGVICLTGKSSTASDDLLEAASENVVVSEVADESMSALAEGVITPETVIPEQEDTADPAPSQVAESAPEEAPSEVTATEEDKPDESTSFFSPKLFGTWELVDYVESGAAFDLSISEFTALEDGSLIVGQAANGAYPQLVTKGKSVNYAECAVILNGGLAQSIETECEYSLEESYTPDGTFAPLPTVRPVEPIQIGGGNGEPYKLPGYYEDYYPEEYLIINVTGTYQESPVTVVDVDTKIVFQRVYPYLDTAEKRMGLLGLWKDSNNNQWTFSAAEDGSLTFEMVDSSGTTYQGVNIISVPSDPNAEDFGEKITFTFDSFSTPTYYITGYSATKLELVSSDGESMTMTRR